MYITCRRAERESVSQFSPAEEGYLEVDTSLVGLRFDSARGTLGGGEGEGALNGRGEMLPYILVLGCQMGPSGLAVVRLSWASRDVRGCT